MRARKILVALLAVGYLAAAHCRIACAAPAPVIEQAVPTENGCHHEESEPKRRDSGSPCCATHLDSTASLPLSAPAITPNVPLFVAVTIPSRSVTIPFPQSASRRNHGPPRRASEVLTKSSLGSRPPPFGA